MVRIAMALGALVSMAAAAAAQTPGEPQPKAAAPSAWTTVTVVPWGKGPGKLEEQIHSTDTRQIYRGPTRIIAFEGGRFAILDVLGNAVEEFDSAGKPAAELGFPAADSKDAETLCIDMASRSPGDYWLLSLGRQALLRVRAGGKSDEVPLGQMPKGALPTAVAMDAHEHLFVLNGYDNSVHRMSFSGHRLPRIKNDLAYPMVVDAKGRFFGMKMANTNDLKRLHLVRWTPPARVEVLGNFDSDLEINRIDVFGVDAAGNVYVYLGAGAIENPSRLEVVRFGPDGKLTGRAPCPPDPIELNVLHAKAVSPDGTVYAINVTKAGLEVLRLSGF